MTLKYIYIDNKKEIGCTLLRLPVDTDSWNQRAIILISFINLQFPNVILFKNIGIYLEKFYDLIKSVVPLWSSTFSVPF